MRVVAHPCMRSVCVCPLLHACVQVLLHARSRMRACKCSCMHGPAFVRACVRAHAPLHACGHVLVRARLCMHACLRVCRPAFLANPCMHMCMLLSVRARPCCRCCCCCWCDSGVGCCCCSGAGDGCGRSCCCCFSQPLSTARLIKLHHHPRCDNHPYAL